MAIVIKHAFQSTIADDPADLAAGYLTPSRWNAAMSITGLTANQVLLSDGTDLTQSANLTFNGTALTASVFSAGAGSKAAPSISFSGDATSGFYSRAVGFFTWAIGGLAEYEATSTNFNLAQANTLGWAVIESSGADVGISRLGPGSLAIGTGGGGSFTGSMKLTNLQAVGYAELDEMTAPAGAANSARLFTQDNGSGKTQLMVIFGSGSAIQLAIEV